MGSYLGDDVEGFLKACVLGWGVRRVRVTMGHLSHLCCHAHVVFWRSVEMALQFVIV